MESKGGEDDAEAMSAPRFQSGSEALEQLQGIEEAQRRLRQGKLDQAIIDSIEKSKRRLKNRLDRIATPEDASHEFEE